MKSILVGKINLFVFLSLGAISKQPNIVVIMADDAGYSDFGCYGGEIETPVLDKLTYDGLRFSQFYNTGRCCPSRAALLTGVYQHQAGMGHMSRDRGGPSYSGTILPDVPTMAERFRKAGYKLVAMHDTTWELYDMAEDRSELNDLSKKMPSKAKELSLLYEAWAKRVGALPWNEVMVTRKKKIKK